MSFSENTLQIATQLITKDFELEDQRVSFNDLDKLKYWLTSELRILIDRDFHKLLNMLYRIDIDEQKSKIAFASEDPALSLAELIIERELQKVQTRKKYR